MGKTGLKHNVPAHNSDPHIDADMIIEDMKRQAGGLKSSAFGDKMTRGQVDGVKGRPYEWMYIDGCKVKKYIDNVEQAIRDGKDVMYEEGYSSSKSKGKKKK